MNTDVPPGPLERPALRDGDAGGVGRLDYPGLREAIEQKLRQAIQSGALQPGERLVEADLAKQLGISRGSLREAMRQLEQDGLIKKVPRHGTEVVCFSKDDIYEIYSLRSVIEGLACRIVTQKASEADRARFHDLVGQMREAGKVEDLSTLVEYDLSFHEAICSASRHERLMKTWLGLSQQLRVLLMWREKLYHNLAVAANEHLLILESMERGDVGAAEAAMQTHILRAGEELVARL